MVFVAAAAVKYAKVVSSFANLPDGRGANHALLANYFSKLLSHQSISIELPEQEERFALSYIFGKYSTTDKG